MPKPRYDEDLFQDTSMTFGEHLEELRTCLMKALIGLIIGFVIGLYFGGDVVAFIQRPLSQALTNYYQTQAKDRAKNDEMLAGGQGIKVPGQDEPVTPSEFLVDEEELLPEKVFVRTDRIIEELRKKQPKEFGKLQVIKPPTDPESLRETLLPIVLWRPNKDDPRIRVKALNAHEAFVIYIKGSLLVGAILASPWIFYQIWVLRRRRSSTRTRGNTSTSSCR